MGEKQNLPELEGIEGNAFYSATDIANKGWFYWLTEDAENARRTIARILDREYKLGRRSVLKPTLMGEGPAQRWYVKGENIIKFVTQWEDERKTE